MIDYVTGDVLAADSEALVNSVNCVGVMGRGVALQFKRKFPDNFKAYKVACDWGEVQLGRMFVFETGDLIPRYIINFPTKRHWRGNSRLDDIQAGLSTLVAEIEQRQIRSIALPPLGCGLGGLKWPEVKPRIHVALAELPDVDTLVFEPQAATAPMVPPRAQKLPDMTPGRAALIGLMHRYLVGLAEPFVTLLEVHKLLYFMQTAGEPLRLKYVKAPQGPYAENLRHVLHALEGHYVKGSGDGDRPDQPLYLIPGVAGHRSLGDWGDRLCGRARRNPSYVCLELAQEAIHRASDRIGARYAPRQGLARIDEPVINSTFGEIDDPALPPIAPKSAPATSSKRPNHLTRVSTKSANLLLNASAIDPNGPVSSTWLRNSLSPRALNPFLERRYRPVPRWVRQRQKSESVIVGAGTDGFRIDLKAVNNGWRSH